jgi:hypothetical protein
MPMPVIINPKNTGEYRKERERENAKKPEITSARWGKGQIKEGEDVEITAQVKEIEDGNVMTFQVWKEGQDPAAHVAFDRINAVIEGGSAKEKWKPPVINGNELPPENDPKYFLTVHSAWCPMKKSENMTVELKRPEIKKCEWQDKDNDVTQKNVLGETAMLVAETKDVEDGKTVTFKLYPEDADTNKDKPVKILDAAVKENKAEYAWDFSELQSKMRIEEGLYRYYKGQGYDIEREKFEFFLEDYSKAVEGGVKKKPKYFFTAGAARCKTEQSGTVEVSKTVRVTLSDGLNNPEEDVDVMLKESDGTEHKNKTNKEGYVEFEDLIPEENHIQIVREKKTNGR